MNSTIPLLVLCPLRPQTIAQIAAMPTLEPVCALGAGYEQIDVVTAPDGCL